MMILIIPAAVLAAIIAGAGGIGQSIVGGINNRKMLKYNHPQQQLKRLNQAGLPMAAYMSGQTGQQSTMPDISGIGNAGRDLGSFLHNEQTAQGIKLLLEQIKGAGISNDVAGMNRDILGETFKAAMEEAAGFTDGRTNAKNMYMMEAGLKEFDYWIRRNDSTMSALRTAWEEGQWETGKWDELFKEQLRSLASRSALTEQMFASNEAVATAKQKVMDLMEKDGYGLGDALITLLLNAMSGKLNVGGFGIGF